MQDLNYGKGYNLENKDASGLIYMPEELKERSYFPWKYIIYEFTIVNNRKMEWTFYSCDKRVNEQNAHTNTSTILSQMFDTSSAL